MLGAHNPQHFIHIYIGYLFSVVYLCWGCFSSLSLMKNFVCCVEVIGKIVLCVSFVTVCDSNI